MRWEINQKVDIKRGAQGIQLWPNALMILGDNEAHIWKIKILDNGEDIVVSGTVTGYFVRPDGNTIMVAGTLEGNIASVILPQAVYAQKGNVQGIVRLSYGNGQIVTLSALILPIRQVLTDSIIDPGEVIPSLEELLAMIDETGLAKDAANSAAALANEKAGIANAAALNADEKAALANEKATLANTKAGEATDAATLANQKAGLADAAATLANQKAALADEKATLANEKAGLADTAATGANAAKVSTETATLSALGAQDANANWTKDAANPMSYFPAPSAPLYFRREGTFTQAGSGDPSPTNIRPITPFMANGAQIALRNSGKNLLDLTKYLTRAGGDTVVNQDPIIRYTAVGGAIQNVLAFKVPVMPLTTYVFSFQSISGPAQLYGSRYELSETEPTGSVTVGGTELSTRGSVFTTENNTKWVLLKLLTSTGQVGEYILSNIQLELGSVATPYEPYVGSTTTLTAPEEIAAGWINNRGEGQATWGKYVLNGSENYNVTADLGSVLRVSHDRINPITSNSSPSICSHLFKLANYSLDAQHFYLDLGTIWMFIPKSILSSNDVSGVKAYLAAQHVAGTPVTFYYQLATSQTLTPVSAPLNSIPATDLATERQNVFTSSLSGVLTYPKNKVRHDRILNNAQLWRKTASGNPVSVYPVPESPLYPKVSGTFTQEGTGDPSPENIRPITPWLASGGTVKVNRTGKNICPPMQYGEIDIDTGGLIANWTVVRTVDFVPIVAGKTYQISRSYVGASIKQRYYDVNKVYIGTDEAVQSAILTGTSSGVITIKSDSAARYMKFVVNSSTSYGITAAQMLSAQYQIEEGSTATPYEPYSGQEIALTAPQEIAAGWMDNEGNGQADVYMYRLTGLENVEPSTIQTLAVRFNITLNTSVGFFTSNDPESVSSHCIRLSSGTDIERFYGMGGGKILLYIFKSRLTGWDDEWTSQQKIDAAKAYFAAQYAVGTPITFAMKLSNSVSITPTIASLTALPQLDRITPRQNVLTASTGNIELTYAKSPIREADELAAAIALL